MSHPIYIVDAFTDKKFGGNTAGVCLLEQAKSSNWMQKVAAEMNLAETAFLYPNANGYHLQWFSPTVEVALCGHATLATAHILWQTKILPEETPAQFETLSGRLTAVRAGDWINLNFPSTPAAESPAPDGLISALGVAPLYIGRSRFDVLVEVGSEAEVVAASPDFVALKKIPDIRGAIVTARSESSASDFVSRFFAPAVGIDEDPATGSSHCCLSPYWSSKLGRDSLTGRQLSNRGGVIKTHLLGDRVQLSGQAVTTVEGTLVV